MSEPAVCRCGAAAHPSNEARCANGHTLPGHSGPALKHGAWSLERGRGEAALPPDLRQSVEDFRSQVVLDNGGVAELTAVKAGYIRRLAAIEATARLLEADLTSNGLFTAKRRVRSTYSRWLETLDRWDRFAQRVGVERKARPVTFEEFVRGE